MEDTVRWTVKGSRETDTALRSYLARRRMKKGDIAKFGRGGALAAFCCSGQPRSIYCSSPARRSPGASPRSNSRRSSRARFRRSARKAKRCGCGAGLEWREAFIRTYLERDIPLLGLRTRDDVLAHPVAGPSWEAYAIENLCGAAPLGAEAWFFRTAASAEIDLVLELAGARVFAIEIKRSLAPVRSKGFELASADVGAIHRYVAYPGGETFALDRRTTAIPLGALVATILATARR